MEYYTNKGMRRNLMYQERKISYNGVGRCYFDFFSRQEELKVCL